MAEATLTHPRPSLLAREIKTQGYWATVTRQFRRDRLALLGVFLFLFILSITLGAPWISSHVLGFTPTGTDLRARNKPPTWMAESWPTYQAFSAGCNSNSGCQWSLWPAIVTSSLRGFGSCLRAQPGECHWMGTDDAGRDVLTRGLYGGRVSLRIGLTVALVILTIGLIVGLVSGYYAATFLDDIINAVILLLDSIPLLFLLIILNRTIQPTPEGLALILGLFGWVGLARLLRGQIFTLRERDFVVASRSIGASQWRIMFRQILPNLSSILIVAAIFDIAGAILAEASLSYLGVGIVPPVASWGNMMEGSLGNFTVAPWLVLAPGLFIFLTTLSIYLIGDGLRDAFDPMLKR